MGSFLVTATNEVTFSTNSPTAAQIEGALQAIPVVATRADRAARGLPDDGGWVGSARITRRANALPPGGRLTDVAWLYSWPDRIPASAEATTAGLIQEYIRANAVVALPVSAGWKDISIVPYNPTTNGTVAWWESGDAGRTVTRDAFDLNQQTGSNQTRDNPTGPTTTHAPDFDPLGTHDPNSAMNKLLGLATTLAWVAGGIAAMVYVVGPIVGAVLSPKTAVPARTNPTSQRLEIVAVLARKAGTRDGAEFGAHSNAARALSYRIQAAGIDTREELEVYESEFKRAYRTAFATAQKNKGKS
ncbi:MAG: hypothetical protein ABI652_07905 [Acidobacteriota bacterium]